MNEFSWLLISDLHLKSGYATWNQSVVLRDLVRDIRSRTQNHPTIKFIVVSGDLAHEGKREQYNLVESFLDDLVSAVQLTRSDVFIVPGNHDVDRDIQELTFHGSRSQFTDANNVERFLSRPHERATLLRRLGAFNRFESRFCAGIEREFTQDRLAYISRRVVDGLPLGIVGLNSALACGNDDDHRKIVVGDHPVIDIVEKIRESDVRLIIGVVHHPPVWLREFDQRTFERRFLPMCDILHRGHLHEPEVRPTVTSPETQCLVVSAGASYVQRQVENSYAIVSLDVAAPNCKVTRYEYDSHSGAFGVADSQTHTVRLRGDIPGDVSDLTAVIRSVCMSAGHLAPYLAALIDGKVSDVPVRQGDNISFGAPELLEKADPSLLELTRTFLNVRNSLLAFPNATPLEDRIVANADPIIRYATHLDSLANDNAAFRGELQSRVNQAASLCEIASMGPQNSFVATLDQFAAEQEWLELEGIARRYQTHLDPHVRRVATSRLALALAHSDDLDKKSESRAIADDLIGQVDATEADYELGFVINRNHREDDRASQLLLEAVETFGTLSASFMGAAYTFAVESGNAEMKRRLDAIKE